MARVGSFASRDPVEKPIGRDNSKDSVDSGQRHDARLVFEEDAVQSILEALADLSGLPVKRAVSRGVRPKVVEIRTVKLRLSRKMAQRYLAFSRRANT
jgi:hypothetical protein